MIDRKVAIVGGTGEFGQHLGERLEENNEVYISGKDLESAKLVAENRDWNYGESTEIVKDADVVIIAVPISVTVDVINEIGPQVSEDALLCDITSVKQEPVEVMKEYSSQVLGMHPMYAPSNSIEGQKVVMCPEKGKKWTEMEEFWVEHGADLHFTNPEEHDKAMSLVQGLMHFSELVVADVIRKSDFSGGEMEEFSSPIYQLITDLTARMLNQKSGLYESIQKQNEENDAVRQRFIDSAEEIKGIIEDGSSMEFEDRFSELGQEFETGKAQETTDLVIEHLSEIKKEK